jgi:putative ABC transport system substrate-binding protein
MAKKFIIWQLATIFLGTFSLAQAQQPKRIYRLGYIAAGDSVSDAPRVESVRRAVREFGYVEGQNLVVEYRYADGKDDRYAALATELVSLKVDLIIVGGGDNVIQAVMNATKTIPIVLTGFGSDPVTAGFVESLARPGGNVTGVTSFSRELGGKRLDLLKEVIPKLARVAVIFQRSATGTVREVKEDLPVAAQALRLTVKLWPIADANGFEKAFAELRKERVDGLYLPGGGGLMRLSTKRIADFALKNRLPSMFGNSEGVEAGGLVFYGADLDESYRLVAWNVDRILKGAKPADLPVQRPTKFQLMFNLKTAKQIGITIPQSVLYRADRVIR